MIWSEPLHTVPNQYDRKMFLFGMNSINKKTKETNNGETEQVTESTKIFVN